MNESQINNEIKKIEKLLGHAQNSIEKAMRVLDSVKRRTEKSYEDMPGVEGVFEGTHMAGEDGKKYPIPPNYAAKSLLVYGDKLKMVEEGGKTLFKQIDKVDRKEVEGMVTKKDGKWHVLTDGGSHAVLETAAEYRKAAVNDEALVLLPADNLSAPFAALDKIIKESGDVYPSGSDSDGSGKDEDKKETTAKSKKSDKDKDDKKDKKPTAKSKSKPAKAKTKPVTKKKTESKKETPSPKSSKNDSDFGEDDLR